MNNIDFQYWAGPFDSFYINEGNGVLSIHYPLSLKNSKIIELPYNPVSKRRFKENEEVEVFIKTGAIGLIVCLSSGNLVLKDIMGNEIKTNPIEREDYEYKTI